MNADAVYKVSRDEFGGNPSGGGQTRNGQAGGAPASVGLWIFMGVVTALFTLFLAAYAMRMDSPDWQRIALPWQVWLSTGLLAAGSVAMQAAVRLARTGRMAQARHALRWAAWAPLPSSPRNYGRGMRCMPSMSVPSTTPRAVSSIC